MGNDFTQGVQHEAALVHTGMGDDKGRGIYALIVVEDDVYVYGAGMVDPLPAVRLRAVGISDTAEFFLYVQRLLK